ncbi:hypothetical protein ACF07K_31740, partial [Streptomyces sp. NPDC015350]
KDGKDSSAKDIDTATKAPPDTSAAKDKPVTPLTPDQAPANPGAPSATDAIPDKQPAAVTDFSAGPAANDQALADAEVTEDQLARGNEPEFDQALTAKKTAETDSVKAPAKGKAAENQQLDAAKANAAASGTQAINTLTATRATAGKQVDGGKDETKSKDEKRRAEVTAKLQKVYDTTKKDVETTLSGLDTKVDTAFTQGEKAARDAFTADHKRRMKKYKDKRYSGMFGGAKWAKDKLLGMPEEANALFQEARKLYVAKMQTVISSVADLIGTELGRAKARIAKGRTELKAEVDRLPADLREFGQEAATDFAGKFDDLEATVNEKSEQLVQDLAQKYTAALNKIDEEIKKLQEANKGLVDKAKDAIVGVLKTINELKNLLLGILAKAASAIMKIIKDPIGFLGNLVKAVGAGLNLFLTNIATHLKTGVVSWLLGTAVKAGLELPPKFDLKGIIQLIASLLGLTWDNIRARITRKGIPDQAMTAVESSVPVAKKLATEGPAGAAKEIQTEAGDLKATILEKLTSYLIPTVIIAGITWIISLLNPASAFIRAVKGIIDIVTFIVNQGAQIADFVNAVLDAVIAIANGGSAGVPKMVETALATSVPLLIGFLASLLGIGNLANKVKSVFHAVAKPVNRAIDKIINLITKKGKALWNKLKQNKKDVRNDETPNSRNVKREARRLLAGPTSSPMPTESHLDMAIKKTLEALRPQGLKSLRKKKGENSTSFKVVARASAPEEVAAATVASSPENAQEKKYEEEIKKYLHKHGKEWSESAAHEWWWEKQLENPKAGESKIWPSRDEVLSGTNSGGIRYLREDRSAYAHPDLVKYFTNAPGNRSADTKTFRDHVFTSKKRNPVRDEFLKKIGEEAAVKVSEKGKKGVAESNATAEAKAGLTDQIGAIGFQPGLSHYGKFHPFLKDSVEPDLVEAVKKAGGIISFLEKMLLGEDGKRKPGDSSERSVQGITWDKFSKLWNTGSANSSWVKDRFRDAMPGHHEWIPSNLIRDVLEHAISLHDADRASEGLRWLRLHHVLRSRTNFVIWKRPEGPASPPGGHVGTFYENDADKSVFTNGTEDFHERLRKIFQESREEGALACLDKIIEEIEGGLVWSGRTLGLAPEVVRGPVGARYWIAPSQYASWSIEKLAKEQSKNYQEILKDFEQARKEIEKIT